MYYDYDKISSYNATFNMIITNRGFGKTYGAKKRAINKFLKKGEQFIYVRRYKSELKKVKDKFFEKIKKEFEGHKFEIKGFTAYIDNKTVFVYWYADLFYFSNHGTIMTNYVLDGNSHSENMILLTSKEPMLKGLVKAFSRGKCRFQTQSIKEISLQMFKKIGFNY